MKNTNAGIVALIFMAVYFTSCQSHNMDVTIKTDLTTKAKAELDFVGVTFTVKDRIVTLNGVCATQNSLNQVYTIVDGLYGVKGVINNLRVSDVVIGTDWLLKRSVDSMLRKYPGVEAITRDSTVTLRGNIAAEDTSELLKILRSLRPKELRQSLTTY